MAGMANIGRAFLLVLLGGIAMGCGNSDGGSATSNGGSSGAAGDGPAASQSGASSASEDKSGSSGPTGSAFGPETGATSTGSGARPTGSGSASGSGGGGNSEASGTATTPEELFPDVAWDTFTIVYSPMYSAYDGVHTFQVPAYVNGINTDVESWYAFPSDAVSFSSWVSDDGEKQGVLMTMESAEPEVLIAATLGGLGGTAKLYITEATPEEWEIGKDRYQNGTELDVNEVINNLLSDPEFVDKVPDLSSMVKVVNGEVMFSGTAADLGLTSDMRCDSCHTSGAENFQVQHTPTQAARFSDEDLTAIFRTGMKPEGVGYRVLPESYQGLYPVMHKWDATEEEIKGLVVYLRSLTPEGQGDIVLPNGLLVGANFDITQLPTECQPDTLDIVLCLLILPPSCAVGDAAFDVEMCTAALADLGVDLDTAQ